MRFRYFLFLILALLIFSNSSATHLRAGEITIRRLCPTLEYEITLTVYTDIGLGVSARFGGGLLNFGDGSDPVEVPIIESPLNLGNDVGFNQYSIIHVFPANGRFTISYTESNRNQNVLNMSNSGLTEFHLATQIVIDPIIGCNDTPKLLIPPIDRGCVGSIFFHNPGAFDPDGDSISYEFITPKRDVELDVSDYVFPNEVQPRGTTEDGSGEATLDLNLNNGLLTWDAPALPGEYNLAFMITEWREINGERVPLGWVIRDMQIIVEDCNNERPELLIPEDVCVVAGEIVKGDVQGYDADGDSILMEAFGGPFEVDPAATINPNPQEGFQPSPGRLAFEWQTACSHVRVQPYQVEFKASDNPPKGPSLVDFGSWFITVLGPAPELSSATLVLSETLRTELEWNPYSCSNAEKIQVWRRVDSFALEPDECATGMPPGTGYSLLATLPATSTSFIDHDLDEGASYCYRLVATYPQPAGGESIVSNEICPGPIVVDAPVTTHVTVDKTDFDNGEITVSWRSPFEINSKQIPPPYTYQLWRARGLRGDDDLTLVANTADTAFTDSGLNTVDYAFNYKVVLFNAGGINAIDTSAVASSIWVEPKPLTTRIELNWEGAVPWSNVVQEFPFHYIYRDNVVPDDPDQLILLDSVDVTLGGFTYLDSGQANGTPLDEAVEYCYFVTTVGSYGNPSIAEPQLNNSQIVCAQPNDSIPPCAPILSIDETDCNRFLQEARCDVDVYSNIISWRSPEDLACQQGIRYYNVYFSRSGEEGSFELIPREEQRRDTTFVHQGLTSFAGCYKVTAVDRSNNESEFSEMVCNDNCPNFVLPNVFTPNGDGVNDNFTAYAETSDLGLCPRFVEAVHFSVYNRWGRREFVSISGAENSVLINWDGKDSNGYQVAAGVYYYVANVTFNLLDTNHATQQLTGWVQVLR